MKKKPITPRSKIRRCLRQLILQSRERSAALKMTKYKCIQCGIKQSAAKGKVVKLECHHDPPLTEKWEEVINIISELLASPQYPLCEDCHKEVEERKKL